METDFEDRLRNNASCIIRSGGSRPSDKGGGGGVGRLAFIQTLR